LDEREEKVAKREERRKRERERERERRCGVVWCGMVAFDFKPCVSSVEVRRGVVGT